MSEFCSRGPVWSNGTMAEGTLLGRATGGDVAALTAAQAASLIGSVPVGYVNARAGSVTALRESVPRFTVASVTAGTSGVMYVTAVPVMAGDLVTNLTFVSGGTALTMGSDANGHLWFALYGPNGTLLSQSADQGGSATWAGSTAKTLALAAPQTIAVTGIVYAAHMVNAGTGGSPTMPTIANVSGLASTLGSVAGAPTLSGSVGTGLGATAPASLGTVTALGRAYYAALT